MFVFTYFLKSGEKKKKKSHTYLGKDRTEKKQKQKVYKKNIEMTK